MAEKFWLYIDRLTREDWKVWEVRQHGRSRFARAVHVMVPVSTVFRGRSAKQPKAYLEGRGRVWRRADGVLVVE